MRPPGRVADVGLLRDFEPTAYSCEAGTDFEVRAAPRCADATAMSASSGTGTGALRDNRVMADERDTPTDESGSWAAFLRGQGRSPTRRDGLVDALSDLTTSEPHVVIEALDSLAGIEDAQALLTHAFETLHGRLVDATATPSTERGRSYGSRDRAAEVACALLWQAPRVLECWPGKPCASWAKDAGLLGTLLWWAERQQHTNPNGWHFPPEAVPASIWGFVAQNVRAEAPHRNHGAAQCDDCRALAVATLRALGDGDLEAVADANDLTVVDMAVSAIGLDARVVRRLLVRDRAATAEIVKLIGSGEVDGSDLGRLLEALPLDALDGDAAVVVGRRVADRIERSDDKRRDREAVAASLGRRLSETAATLITEVSLLWSGLEALARYEKQGRWSASDEVRGITTELAQRGEHSARAWAISARAVLATKFVRTDTAVELLSLACLRFAEVDDAVDEIARTDRVQDVRDRARGIRARLHGHSDPRDEVNEWLASSAARAFDGTPFIARPLTTLAPTWLGSMDLHDALTRGAQRAATHFASRVRDHGRIEEEALTGALLTELEVAFRGARLSLMAGGRSPIAHAIKLEHRPVTKTQEASWGCDLAITVDADVPQAMRLTLAELVQVKKSEAIAASNSSERWRIDVAQLQVLMSRSECAAYWLVLATGDVACVPARVLGGILTARDQMSQRTATVGYHDVRHAAVGLDQFLPELVMGAWLGSTDEQVLDFAAGRDAGMLPRQVLTVTVSPTDA